MSNPSKTLKMKKLLFLSSIKYLLFISIGLLHSCSKEDEPQPLAPQPVAPVPTSTMSSDEQSLVGNWVMDSTSAINYDSQGDTAGFYTQKYNNPATCKLDLKSDLGSSEGYYKATNGIACSPTDMQWKYGSGTLSLGQYGYEVLTISSTSLKIRYSSSSLSKITYHFHK